MHILLSGRYELAFFSSYPRCGTEEFAGEEVTCSFSHTIRLVYECDLPPCGRLYHLQRDVSDVI